MSRDELHQLAFGQLGLSPQDLRNYSFRDLDNKWRGYDRAKCYDELILRNIAFFGMFQPPKGGPKKLWHIDETRLGNKRKKKLQVIKVTQVGN
jgi:hypothetical protein